MLKRDYILALIEDFFNALTILLEQRQKGSTSSSLNMIEKCYGSLHLSEYQRLNDDLEKLAATLNLDEKPAVPFMEILAGLLMEESYVTEGKEKVLLNRAKDLLEYVDKHDDTFSFDRLEKIQLIQSMLQDGGY